MEILLGAYFFFPVFCPTASCLHDLELLLAGSVVDVENGLSVCVDYHMDGIVSSRDQPPGGSAGRSGNLQGGSRVRPGVTPLGAVRNHLRSVSFETWLLAAFYKQARHHRSERVSMSIELRFLTTNGVVPSQNERHGQEI